MYVCISTLQDEDQEGEHDGAVEFLPKGMTS